MNEDFLGENMPDTPPSLIGLGPMAHLHRAQPIRPQELPNRGTKDFKREAKMGRTTPAGVGPLSCLERVLLTSYSMNFACLSYHGL